MQQDGVLPPTRGRIWCAGKPHNAEGSQLVHFTDLGISGATDNTRGDLLVAIANSLWGDLHVAAHLDMARNETLEPCSNGLYMPVWLTGRASVTFRQR